MSVRKIAEEIGCSENKVTYWLQKHNIDRRTISEAIYTLSNPKGDPFVVRKLITNREWFIYGLGLGLFWGEGNKVNKHSVRLGNSDPALIKSFLFFLETAYGVDKRKFRFGLQIFTDISPDEARDFWRKHLNVPEKSFYKTIVTKSVRAGTYRKKVRMAY